MLDQARTLVDQQLRRVRRRLFLQVVVESLLLGVALGLLLTMVWFVVRPFAWTNSSEAVRWTVPGVLLGLGAIASLVMAWTRRPSLIASSLALDEKFSLKERVTTFMTLSSADVATPAGQALLHDVTARLSRLEVASEFPLRVPAKQWLVPGGALVLALAACIFDPYLAKIRITPRLQAEEPVKKIDAKEIQQQLDELKKIVQKRNQDDSLKSEELKSIEQEFEKLINDPIDGKNEEKVREQLDKMRTLEDKIKDRLDGLRDKAAKFDALKEQLKQLSIDKDKLAKDGPAKDFEDALAKGDLEKAKAALDKMAKDLKNDKLDPAQKKELADQFKRIEENLQKLMQNDDLLKQLKKQLDEGKIDKEAFDRAVERFKDLQELTDLVGDAKELLKDLADGKNEAGKEALDKLLKRLEEAELNEKEIQDLLRDQQEIEDAMRLLMRAMNGDEFGEGDGMNGGQFPGGKRPIDPNDPNSKIKNERSRAIADSKGIQRVTGYARGGNFSKIPAKAVEGAFQQAVQNAPEAIDRQRIPDDYADTAREYFRRLGNQK